MDRFHGNDLQDLLRQDSTGTILAPQPRVILPSEYLAAYALRIRQTAMASYQHDLAVANALSRASTYGTVDIGRPYPIGYNAVGLSRLADLQEMQGLPIRHSVDVLGGIPVAHSGILSHERRLEMMGDAGQTYPKQPRAEEPSQDIKNPTPRCKKPKEMPKRPLSAYNIFFKEERNNILDSIPSPDGYSSDNDSESEDQGTSPTSRRRGPSKPSAGGNKKKRKPHGKIGFENLAKTIGSRWKSLSPDRLAHYKSLAEEDMIRYKKEMKEYSEKEARKNVTQERLLQKKEDEEKEMKMVQQEELRKERERVAKQKRTIEALIQENHKDHFDQRDCKKMRRETTHSVGEFPRSYLKRTLSPPSQVLSSPPPLEQPVRCSVVHPLVDEQKPPSLTLSMVHRMSNNSILLKQVREAARMRNGPPKNTRGL